ncbi:UxaA family hydrolase [Deltaproteobacteria bacterium OttesenSCG-928-M10]|nr:UxaA family hydrolase [Deltaproteobacteria bacterium OttesenSCG-928-M10]
MKESLMMYARPNGEYGARNRVAVLSTVACANHVAEEIARAVPSADAYPNNYGCDQLGPDFELTHAMMLAMGRHPNAGAVLVVGLGCEQIDAETLAGQLAGDGRPVEWLEIQQEGGTTAGVLRGRALAAELERKIGGQKREKAPWSALCVGLECGGSDYTSGLAANPALGLAADALAEAGARVIFGETTELMGAEAVTLPRCVDDRTRQFISDKIKFIEDYARSLRIDIRGAQPSPGNIRGGLSTIEEKSLGAVCKSGRGPIVDALEFGQKAVKPGVSFMNTPGNDLACTLGLCAGGAQMVIFTSGRGTPMGFAAAPVVKVTANPRMARQMAENFDCDLSGIISGGLSLAEGGRLVLDLVAQTAEGREAAAEKLGHKEFGYYRISEILL